MYTRTAIYLTFTGKVTFTTNFDAISNNKHDWTPIKYQNVLHYIGHYPEILENILKKLKKR